MLSLSKAVSLDIAQAKQHVLEPDRLQPMCYIGRHSLEPQAGRKKVWSLWARCDGDYFLCRGYCLGKTATACRWRRTGN